MSKSFIVEFKDLVNKKKNPQKEVLKMLKEIFKDCRIVALAGNRHTRRATFPLHLKSSKTW